MITFIKLRPTQQVRLLIAVALIATLLNIGLAVFVIVKAFRPLNYQVQVNPPPEIDYSFLDFVTNSPPSAVSVSSDLPKTTEKQSVLSKLPLDFDSYCEIHGVSYALFRGHAFKVGDFINGRMVESISPWAVVIQGQVYNIIQKVRKGVQDDRIPVSDTPLHSEY